MENFYSDLLKNDSLTRDKNKSNSKIRLKNIIENNRSKLDSL